MHVKMHLRIDHWVMFLVQSVCWNIHEVGAKVWNGQHINCIIYLQTIRNYCVMRVAADNVSACFNWIVQANESVTLYINLHFPKCNNICNFSEHIMFIRLSS